ncbi:hypothetical protein SAMN05216552_104628 [Pseudoduganella namucuonensis]|uniref:Uncharacterized protein n=2 Tax=Pseudoduganella namucuonensis TaxID=1035707 RepID=A0A1I7M0K0_9BURK|nr:hypothetical protein SAMN05216552_104628 [Pseudoduganella namucuonensis]
MPGTTTPQISPALSVDQLMDAAFHPHRDPRSIEYKNGTRAALAFRIEGKRIVRPYAPASAADDAYDGGLAEGHAIWRAAVAKIGGAA